MSSVTPTGAGADRDTPRLYYMPRTRSSRVLWLLEEIGQPYDLTQIAGAERRSAQHLQRHPLGRVPALELSDGTTMFESAAICLQLADMYPDAGLIAPPGSSQRALVYQWVLFAVAELEAPLFRWIGELGDGTTESPSRDRFTAAAGAMQSVLDAREWLLGANFSVADVMCASVLQGANSRELLRPWPALEAYVQRSQARPAHARAAAISDRPRI
jgi:glutathione S-transferase